MLRRALILLAVAALVTLVAAGRVWGRATYDRGDVLGPVVVEVTGRQVTDAVTVLSLVALAGIGGVLATRGALRVAVSLVVALAGAGIAAASVLAVVDPTAALAGVGVADRPGLAGSEPVAVALTVWPWVGVAGGLVVTVAAGLVIAARGGAPVRAQRWDRPRPAAPGVAAEESAWAALSAGEDPTETPEPGASGPGRTS